MALPQKKKKIFADISDAVHRAAGLDQPQSAGQGIPSGKKAGRPSPRSGIIVRQTLLLSEETAERLTLAVAEEQVKRRKNGQKLDKSQLIEEMILKWLDERG
jgi:hypothetical protein